MATGRELVTVNREWEADVIWSSTQISDARLARAALGRLVQRRGVRLARERLPGETTRGQDVRPKLLWYSAENVRPPHEADLTFSFDLDDYGGQNFYLPYWWLTLGFERTSSQLASRVFLRARETPSERPPNFCCAFFGKMDAFRRRLLQALAEIGDVHVYGPAVGCPVPDKIDVAREYRFVLCPENDLYPGYVTEKCFDAWRAGCIPLWWGADKAGFLNQDALVNADSFDNLQSFVRHVRLLETHREFWFRTHSEPLLSRPPELGGAVDVLRRTFSS